MHAELAVDTNDSRENAILEHALGLVRPVLIARVANGTWEVEREPSGFVVMFDEGNTTVQLDDESNAWTLAVVTRSYSEGEEIPPGDLLTEAVPVRDDPDLPFIRGEATQRGWRVTFNFGRRHPLRLPLLAAGSEFARAARSALNDGLLRAFVENAFHATERLAKAELLSYGVTTQEVLGSRRHQRVASTYNLWARLENTEQRFADLLNTLGRLRPAATYAEADLSLTQAEAAELMATLTDLEEHVVGVARDGSPRGYKIIATRSITAGELVGTGDGALRPQRG